ncbi:homing endonuclease associated repeat-containing protein [Nocardioides cavernaquae]|uniref:homing endonuclease associated repeat-containing protein n=1 Tax=Nocardioides cavernaquae TaxID=2321396 RepID=UPI001C7D4B28|nr:hypothetical protein [Nocardioides cavernaquae]
MRAPTFTDDQLLEAVRTAAAEVGAPLPVTAYDAWRKAGDRDCASGTLVIRRLGSWNAACEAAGVATNKTRSTSRRWTDEEVVAIVARYLTADGSPGSYAGYVDWARETEGVPSGPTLRQRFAWNEVKERARVL